MITIIQYRQFSKFINKLDLNFKAIINKTKTNLMGTNVAIATILANNQSQPIMTSLKTNKVPLFFYNTYLKTTERSMMKRPHLSCYNTKTKYNRKICIGRKKIKIPSTKYPRNSFLLHGVNYFL